MKPRHVRRIIIGLGVVGVLLLVASGVVSLVDTYNFLRGDATDGQSDADTPGSRDDPGGFRRFQDELVRRKEEELKEVGATAANVTRPERTPTNHHDDAIVVSEGDAMKFVRRATRWNEHRLQRVQEVCSRHNLGLYRSSARRPDFKLPPTPQYAVFYYDRSHKMAWCPLYKAGSSSWLHNMCLLGGYSEQELRDTSQQLSTLARKAYPELEYPEAEEALRGSRKLLVVRHPFGRLLSAYRDKLENRVAGAEHGTAHFYRKYGRKIVEKYRKGGAATPTGEVVRPDQVVLEAGKKAPAGDEPTFKEFVQYLIDTDLSNYADDHWIPYYLFCTPCLLNYDIIAKVETYLEDQVYMIRALGLQDRIRPRWRHRTNYASSGENNDADDIPVPTKGTVDDIAKKYFSQISVRELQALHEKYKLDFEMFDYTIDEYLPLTSSA